MVNIRDRRFYHLWERVTSGKKRVAKDFNISETETAKRIILTEPRRHAFITRHFNASISDIYQYDMALNTDRITIDHAVAAIETVVLKRTTSDIT